jgi:polar amino acid transport system substrate-binding protein
MYRRGVVRGLALGLCLALIPSLATARCEGVVPEPKPQNTFPQDVGRDFDEIFNSGWIEFAVYDDFAPYSWQDKGQPRGTDIDIGRMMAKKLGVEARFRFVLAGDDLNADLQNYVWKGAAVGGRVSDAMLHVPYNSDFACRLDQVIFTGLYFDEKIVIGYNKADYTEKPPVPAYFRYDTVGVENDSISDFYMSTLLGSEAVTNIHRYATTLAAMAALAAGEVKGVMGPRGQVEYGLTAASAMHEPPLPGFSTGTWTLGLAVHISHSDLGYALDDAIAAGLADNSIAGIFTRYGLSFGPPKR